MPRHELTIEEIKEYEGMTVRVIANFRAYADGAIDKIWKTYEYEPDNLREWKPVFRCPVLYVKDTFTGIDETFRQELLADNNTGIHAWLVGTICEPFVSEVKKVSYTPELGYFHFEDGTKFEGSEYVVFNGGGMFTMVGSRPV